MAEECKATHCDESQKIASGAISVCDEEPSRFVKKSISQHEVCKGSPAPVNSDLEDDCIYILDDRCVDVCAKSQGTAVYISMQSIKISTVSFEALAAGIFMMLPAALGISIQDIEYSHGLKVDAVTARAFARFRFRQGFFLEVQMPEFRKKVQACLDLLKDRRLWADEKIEENPAAKIPGLLAVAREVRGQFGATELPCTCTISGVNMADSIKIKKEFGVPKPVEVTEVEMVKTGEARGYHGEFRFVHFVHGPHRKVVDISFDEAIFKEDIIKFSAGEKIIVEAVWIERREDGVVKQRTLRRLLLIQGTLFPVEK